MRIERWLYTLPLRLRSVFRRRRLEQELDEELRYHIDRHIEQLVSRGAPAAEARRIALARFGGIERRKDEIRDTRAASVVEHLARDVRLVLRALRRSPVFTAVIVLSLGLGIGATTAVFSVVDNLLVRPLPVAQPEQLVTLREVLPPARTNDELPYEEFTRVRTEAQVFTDVAAMNVFDRSNIALSGPGGGVDAGPARVAIVTGNYFATLGIDAAAGRALDMSDDRTLGAHAVAVVSDAYRERRLGSVRNIVGRTLTLNGTVFDIVGVMPGGFSGHWIERPADIWIPFSMHQQVIVELPYALTHRNDSWLHIVGRLRAGVTIDAARRPVQSVYQRIMRDWAGPDASGNDLRRVAEQRLELQPAEHGYSPRREALRKSLAILSMVVGLVLLVACANVAGLLLVRAAARERETMVRLALGAGAGRLTLQLLTESVVLAVIGGAAGLVLAAWGTAALAKGMTAGPVEMFWGRSSWLTFDFHLDARSLAFTAVVCVLTGVLFGLAPSLRAARLELAHALTGRGAATSKARRFRLGNTLVVFQIAVSVVVMIAAGLFTRTLVNLDSRDLGFDRTHVLFLWTQPSAMASQPAALRDVWHTVLERLSTVPGIVSVSASNGTLLNGRVSAPSRAGNALIVEGQPPKPTTNPSGRTFITPRYFETLGIPLLAGRDFTEADDETRPRVVIINESLARHYFGNESPIGRRVLAPGDSVPSTEIIGVARDVIEGTPRDAGPPFMRTYFSYRDRESERRIAVMMVVVRTAGDPRALIARVSREVREATPALPVLRVDTFDDRLADVLAEDRLITGLAVFLSGLAALLACVGVYGVTAYTTARRTGEIGVRVALGATGRSILRMVLNEGLVLTTIGIAIGVPVALAGSRLIADRLFGVSPTDGPTIVVAVLSLVLVTMLAGYIPAQRAARVDPVVALRANP